jgi:hypothetical protein
MTFSDSLSKPVFLTVGDLVPWFVTGLLVLAWAVGRRGQGAFEREKPLPADLGPFPAVLLFTSESCESCPPARDVVSREAGDFLKEIRFDSSPGLFERVRLRGVPTTLVVGSAGLIIGRFEGIPDAGEIATSIAKLE